MIPTGHINAMAVGSWWWFGPARRPVDGTEEPMAEHELLTPAEVAVMFRVDPKTVTRWARAGKLSAIRTMGGHRRFRASEIQRFVDNVQEGQA
jgi:excisionase family DNA binding protein